MTHARQTIAKKFILRRFPGHMQTSVEFIRGKIGLYGDRIYEDFIADGLSRLDSDSDIKTVRQLRSRLGELDYLAISAMVVFPVLLDLGGFRVIQRQEIQLMDEIRKRLHKYAKELRTPAEDLANIVMSLSLATHERLPHDLREELIKITDTFRRRIVIHCRLLETAIEAMEDRKWGLIES